jgi:hypothetical protein
MNITTSELLNHVSIILNENFLNNQTQNFLSGYIYRVYN